MFNLIKKKFQNYIWTYLANINDLMLKMSKTIMRHIIIQCSLITVWVVMEEW